MTARSTWTWAGDQDVSRVVIVGGGAASAAAVAGLRSGGFDGAITLVCAETTVPYERPPLSKEFLLGSVTGTVPIRDEAWYDAQDVRLLPGTRATALDLTARTVTLDDASGGTTSGGASAPLRYDGLLLATGVRPRRLPGFDGDAVCYLRTIGDATALREKIRAAGHVAVLGGGFIGCEVAAAAVRLGKRVTILEALPTLLHRTLGPVLGEAVADLHRAEGVDVRTGVTVTGVTPRAGGGVRVEMNDGAFGADVLVIGVGTTPNTELAAAAGLPVAPGGGIEVDEYLAAAPGVYAAGDVAARAILGQRGNGQPARIRVEHHDTALRQGAAAARNLLGGREAFGDVHFFWSDQYEHSIQSAGDPDGSEHEIVRGSLRDRSFSAFSLDGDRIRAVIALNRNKDVLAARRLIARGHSVTADQLRDESLPVKRLAGPAAPAVRPRT
jgi:3-phenylpropionate/trans-cinnamate dioxygenase ferredoxin reductase subunit